MAFNPAFADAIASIESGGKYGLLGPITKSGDRAYGKYQVMGANVPVWTKEILGVPMTPDEFLKSPQAQDAVFQGKFGQYVDKYGQEGAAQAWFGGPGAVGKTNRTDQLGTSVGDYGKRFMSAVGPNVPVMGGAPQQVANVNPAQPFGQPMPDLQKPLPPQTPNTALWQPSAPILPQQDAPLQLPTLNAPAIPPVLQQLKIARALQGIPVPAGFQGFRYS